MHESPEIAVGKEKTEGAGKQPRALVLLRGGTTEVKKICSEDGATSASSLQHDLPGLTLDATRERRVCNLIAGGLFFREREFIGGAKLLDKCVILIESGVCFI